MEQYVLPKMPGSEPEWGAHLLDLDAYLDRIDYSGPRTPDLETLRRVQRAHIAAISWELLDMALGRKMALDIPHLQKKIVEDRQGGCCLESNLLFAAALERLGFPLVRHVSRVRRGNNSPTRARSHVVLLVEVEGQLWMADAAFGDEGILEPIPFRDGATLTVGDWTWRLDQDGEEWVLRSQHTDGWFDVYALRLERQYPIDYDMINHFSYADPNSVFLGHLTAQRGDEKVRHVLRDQVLKTTYADGRTVETALTADEVVRELRDTFGIAVRPDDARLLRELFSDEPSAD
ncbi:arylamine N-acetyltransferase family protein [Streptomyces tailanensis]|uniref:arylamine N-acetyltransferase family protein n=1 Tax=Streptomyces tailanensis TaxID=2569858 RepID=UPI00122E11D8|nr:arylamine N-acetyltransferase [Streptomyces tailanensis]